MKRIITTSLIALMTCIALCACSKAETGAGDTEKTLQLTATLTPYYGEGKSVTPVWNATDRFTLLNTANGKTSEAKPSQTGSSAAMMAVAVKDPSDGDVIVAMRNGDASFSDGNIVYKIPTSQNGVLPEPIMAGSFTYSSKKSSGIDVSLSSTSSVLIANVNQEGAAITAVKMEAIGGENIAGNVTLNVGSWTYSASSSMIAVRIASPDASLQTVSIPIQVAPCHLEKGYRLTFTAKDGKTFEYVSAEKVVFSAGGYVESGPAKSDTVRKLLVCGSNKVYLFSKDKVNWGESYAKGLLWSWDCTEVQGTVAGAKASSHIDDARIVNNRHQLLVTCSNNSGWCVLLEPDYDKASGASLLFWTNSATNAHSAEYLSGGYVVVACSVSGGDCLQLYDIRKNNTPIASYPLVSAHGAVWNEATSRLYAIGGTTLQIYKWDSSTPALTLESTVQTNTGAANVTGLHDISLVDANTLIMGGSQAALYNISAGTFTSVPHFTPSGLAGIKSLNYNATTGECFYTFATEATHEGDYSWSSHKVRYTDDLKGNSEQYLLVNDINMYKVRVFNW